jgi:hypothetical protein
VRADLKAPPINAEPWTFRGPSGDVVTVMARRWFDARLEASTFLRADPQDLVLERGPL